MWRAKRPYANVTQETAGETTSELAPHQFFRLWGAELSHLSFFKALHAGFTETMQSSPGEDLVDRLMAQAFESFEGAVAARSEGLPDIACRKGCASCCALRVTATAPEVLLMERCIRGTADALKRAGVDLQQRIASADRAARGLNEAQRAALRKRCPFIVRGLCVIYPARPLACRGHASYDKRACVDALAGRGTDVPVSARHATTRSIVQNAMQSALRDAGYAWAGYELIHALQIALTEESCSARWTGGEDVFAPALAADVSLTEQVGWQRPRVKPKSLSDDKILTH
jgi:Fe-S-cluster containining protein